MISMSRYALSVLILAWAASCAQAATELLGIRTTVDRQATTLLLRLPSQVEYSPTRIAPRLFVVDMTGVSGAPSSDSRTVQSPHVDSYRLLSYRGADDQPHLALELSLKEEGQIKIEELAEGLEVRVEKLSSARAPAKPAALVAAERKSRPKAPAAAPPPAASPARRTSVQEISVLLTETGVGLEVEILGDGAMQYRAMELARPDRLVVDIPDAVNRIRQGRLEVNTPPLKAVRVAQFTSQPPITRVVMDLDSKVPYEVRKQSNGLLVLLGSAEPVASPKPQPAFVPAAVSVSLPEPAVEVGIEDPESSPFETSAAESVIQTVEEPLPRVMEPSYAPGTP